MIDVIQMPREAKKFQTVQACIDLRQRGYANPNVWIGQSHEDAGNFEECDRSDCYHIVNSGADGVVGYARLKPVLGIDSSCEISQRIDEVARTSNRIPAFELQKASFDGPTPGLETPLGDEAAGGAILRELLVEAFRICNVNQARFIFTACDRGGSEELRRLGIRYSTLSVPFTVQDRMIVILCISVTNSNFSSLNPLRLVGGTQLPDQTSSISSVRRRCVEDPSIFDKLEALAELVADTGEEFD